MLRRRGKRDLSRPRFEPSCYVQRPIATEKCYLCSTSQGQGADKVPSSAHNTRGWMVILASLRQFWLILPETTAIGIRLSHASREGSALGRPLSNTWRTCPKVGDNLGKLRIIPHRPWTLECPMVENPGALGWLCDLSGCREGNGLPSLQRVRALRDVARR